MKPDEVIYLGTRLLDAMAADADETAAKTAVEILLGIAFNIAVMASRTGEPL